jgi:hypothetical protein
MNRITRAVVNTGALVAGVAAMATIGAVRADAQVFEPLKFQTTFPFSVAQIDLPAGSYTIRPLDLHPEVIEISNGSTSKFLIVEPAVSPSRAKPDDEVVFTKQGDRYVLSEIWDGSEQAGVEPIPGSNDVKVRDVKTTASHERHHHHVA